MGIPPEDVEATARLARLDLGAERLQTIGDDLETILDYVAKLEELDVEDVEPTAHPTAEAELRGEDELEEPIERDALLENAPETEEHQFRVPKVVD